MTNYYKKYLKYKKKYLNKKKIYIGGMVTNVNPKKSKSISADKKIDDEQALMIDDEQWQPNGVSPVAHIIHNKELLNVLYYHQHTNELSFEHIKTLSFDEKVEFLLLNKSGYKNLEHCRAVNLPEERTDIKLQIKELYDIILKLEKTVDIALIADYIDNSNMAIELSGDDSLFLFDVLNQERIEGEDYFNDPNFIQAITSVSNARKKYNDQQPAAPNGIIILNDSIEARQSRIDSEKNNLDSLIKKFEEAHDDLFIEINKIMEENPQLKKMKTDFSDKIIDAFTSNYTEFKRVPDLVNFLTRFRCSPPVAISGRPVYNVLPAIKVHGGGKPVQKVNDTTVFMSKYNQKKKQPKIGGSVPFIKSELVSRFKLFCKLYELKDLRADLYHDFRADIMQGKAQGKDGAFYKDDNYNINEKTISFNSNMESELMKTITKDLDDDGQLIFGFYDLAADGDVKFLKFGEDTLDNMNKDFKETPREVFSDSNIKKPPHVDDEKELCSNDSFTLTCSQIIDSAGLGTGQDFTCKPQILDYLSYFFGDQNDTEWIQAEPATPELKSTYIINKFYELLLELLLCIIENNADGLLPDEELSYLKDAVEILKQIEFENIKPSDTQSRLKLYVNVAGLPGNPVEWFVSQTACAKQINSLLGSKSYKERNSDAKNDAMLIKLIGTKISKDVRTRIYAILFLKFIGDLSHILLLYILHEMGETKAIVKTNDRCLFYNLTRMINKYNNKSKPSAAPPAPSSGGSSSQMPNDFLNGVMFSTVNGNTPESVKGICQTDLLASTTLSSSSSNFNYKCAILFRKVTDIERAKNYLTSIFKFILAYYDDLDSLPDYIKNYFSQSKSMKDTLITATQVADQGDMETAIETAIEDVYALYDNSIKRYKIKSVVKIFYLLQIRLNRMRDINDVSSLHISNKKLHDDLPDWIDTQKLIQLFTEKHVPETDWVKPDVRKHMWSPLLRRYDKRNPGFPKYFLGLIITQIVNSNMTDEGRKIDIRNSNNTIDGLNFDTLYNLQELIDFLKTVYFWAQEYFKHERGQYRTTWLDHLFGKIKDYLIEFQKHAPRRLKVTPPQPVTSSKISDLFSPVSEELADLVPNAQDNVSKDNRVALKVALDEADTDKKAQASLNIAIHIATSVAQEVFKKKRILKLSTDSSIMTAAVIATRAANAEKLDSLGQTIAAVTAAAAVNAAAVAADADVADAAAADAAAAGAAAVPTKISQRLKRAFNKAFKAIEEAIATAAPAIATANLNLEPLPEASAAAAVATAVANANIRDPADAITEKFIEIFNDSAAPNAAAAADAAATAAADAGNIAVNNATSAASTAATIVAAATFANGFAANYAIDAATTASDKIVDKLTYSVINDFIKRLCLKSWARAKDTFYKDTNIYTSAEYKRDSEEKPAENFENLISEIRQSILQIEELVDHCMEVIPQLEASALPVQMDWQLENEVVKHEKSFIYQYSIHIDTEVDDKIKVFQYRLREAWMITLQ